MGLEMEHIQRICAIVVAAMLCISGTTIMTGKELA
jgi:hypothetical protein